MLKIGSLVDGKYRVLSEIGHGGMSVVYMAINEKANKTWAIKEVRKDGVKDFEVVRQGLIVETEMLKRLDHPNLPSIVDVIENEDTFLIVMDYIEGNPLSQALEEYGAQPQEFVIEWAKQLCDVLDYLHTRNPAIIYRDMKPANIMLKPDGNITLIDFGTAREFKEKNLADTTCLGTVGYAAPEQFGGMGQTDARTDIYCLGATLYHLVTGCNPCEPPYEILPIRSINPQLSSGLERIIIKCTQRNPEDRYQSCSELMYALEHYEEIDDRYRKKQKKKLNLFISSFSVMLAALIGAFGCLSLESKQKKNEYFSYLENGQNTSYHDDVREENLINAIKTEYSDSFDAFDELRTIYAKDRIISPNEMQTINALEPLIKKDIKSNEQKAEICYNIGLTIFSYYSDDGKYADSVVGSTRARTWFSNTKEYAQKSNKEFLKDINYSDEVINILLNLGDFSEDLLNNNNSQESAGSSIADINAGKDYKKSWKYLSGDFVDDLKDDSIDERFKITVCKYGSYILYSNNQEMQKSLGSSYSYDKVIKAYDEMIKYLEGINSEDSKDVLQSVKKARKQFEYANKR